MSQSIVVLVVEDEPLVRLDIADCLSDEGFDVIEAANADEAINALKANDRIRLLFTDVDMPGSMDGLKLATLASERWPPVSIIVTSGHRLVEISDIPDGSVFFAKPYSHAAIVASVREMVA